MASRRCGSFEALSSREPQPSPKPAEGKAVLILLLPLSLFGPASANSRRERKDARISSNDGNIRDHVHGA
jgi:hypothetical protein